jgi:flagellar hook-associated protein 2
MSSILSSTSPTSSGSSSTGSSTSGLSALQNLASGVVQNLGTQGTITSTGLGSGLDISSIVQELVNAEGQPQQELITEQQDQIQSQISAFGTLQASISAVQAALATLSTPQQFESNAATLGDQTLGTATADSTATPGSYTFSVSQLATGSQLQSAAVASSSTAVGTGTLSIGVGSTNFSVDITSANDTLSGIAAAINAAGAGAGVSASIVTTNAGASLVLNSATTGAANQVTVTETDGGTGLSSLTYSPTATSNGLTLVQGAQDAIVYLNKAEYDSASNVVTGLVTGVTLNLTGTSASGATTTLTVAPDPSSTASAIQSFISAYNSLQQTIGSLSSYDSSTGAAGALLSNPLLGNLVNQINETIDATANVPAGSPFSSLAQLGIVANTDGTLSSDATTLNNALTTNLSAVAQLFSGTNGVATQLNNALNAFTEPDGVLATENSTLQQGLTSLANKTTALNQSLEVQQATLYSEYNAMDELVAQLKATGTSLDSQLNSIYYAGEANTPTP